WGDVPIHTGTSTSTSYLVPDSVLTAAGWYAFRVRAGDSGPWSDPAPIVAGAPDALSVDYDGATLRARWSPVPGASGYLLVLIQGGVECGAPWFASGTRSSTPLAFDATKAYSLAVQAVGPGTVGPAATASVFGAGFYPQLAANQAPMLIPAIAPDMAPRPIAI